MGLSFLQLLRLEDDSLIEKGLVCRTGVSGTNNFNIKPRSILLPLYSIFPRSLLYPHTYPFFYLLIPSFQVLLEIPPFSYPLLRDFDILSSLRPRVHVGVCIQVTWGSEGSYRRRSNGYRRQLRRQVLRVTGRRCSLTHPPVFRYSLRRNKGQSSSTFFVPVW